MIGAKIESGEHQTDAMAYLLRGTTQKLTSMERRGEPPPVTLSG